VRKENPIRGRSQAFIYGNCLEIAAFYACFLVQRLQAFLSSTAGSKIVSVLQEAFVLKVRSVFVPWSIRALADVVA